MEVWLLGGLLVISIVVAIILWNSSVKVAAKAPPLLRACPVCGTELAIGENILAERTGVQKEGRERIIIKGCPHCLKKT